MCVNEIEEIKKEIIDNLGWAYEVNEYITIDFCVKNIYEIDVSKEELEGMFLYKSDKHKDKTIILNLLNTSKYYFGHEVYDFLSVIDYFPVWRLRDKAIEELKDLDEEEYKKIVFLEVEFEIDSKRYIYTEACYAGFVYYLHNFCKSSDFFDFLEADTEEEVERIYNKKYKDKDNLSLVVFDTSTEEFKKFIENPFNFFCLGCGSSTFFENNAE